MKIIVIDDEPIIRQGILHKIRLTGAQLAVVGEAGDGISGLELIREHRPQLVLTDIQMPGMNGLELIRLAKEFDPKLEFIILSGYDDFEFAKQAIRYGVGSYLLKPVEDEELAETLTEIMNKLKAEQIKEQSYSELKLLEQSGKEAARQQALTQFIQQGELNPDDPVIGGLPEGCELYAAASFVFEPFTLPHLSFTAEEEALLWFALRNIITDPFQRSGVSGTIFHHALHRHELVYVLGLGSASAQASVTAALQDIVLGIRKFMKLDVTIGFGRYVAHVGQVQDSYKEAKLLIRDAVIHGRNRVYAFQASKPKGPNRKSIIGDEDRQTINEWLKQWETDKIHRWMERRVGAIVQDPESTHVQLEWFCMDLHLIFHKYLLTRSLDAEWSIGDTEDLLQRLQEITHWTDILEQMRRSATNVIGHLSRNGDMVGKDIIESVRIYIETHYGQALSLKSISEQFYIHPNYFSKRFKDKTGVTFIEFLTSVRMKEAASLLLETDLLVQQIAERTGFEDAAYFGSVFRKHYGTTPKQYREQAIS